MSAPTSDRRSLPLTVLDPATGTTRHPDTCRYRCGDQCSQPVPNTSSNPYFGDVVRSSLARRAVLKGLVGGAAVGGLAWVGTAPAAAAPGGGKGRPGLAGFEAIPPTPRDVDDLVVPPGYDWAPVVSWGDPVEPGAPDFDPARQSVEAQKKQAGYNADYLSLRRGGPGNNAANTGLVVFNNEYTNPDLMFGAAFTGTVTAEQARIEMAAHGMTIVEVSRRGQFAPWTYDRGGRRNRRIHAWTPFDVDGPAARHVAMRTSADPSGRRVLGTLNNCAGGDTPWGTTLSGEENFNQYFNTAGAADPEGKLRRYGITGSGRGWWQAEDRFMVAHEPNEVNRFGWIVEVDPDDPTSTPVKHTALGRFKHEGATIRLAADGRAVAYMGDDERFDYVYKFVSRKRYREGDKKHNMTLLSEGDLYVARYDGELVSGDEEFDGTGQWLPLVVGGRSYVRGMTAAEVLIWTRIAADQVGPTKMDRPEDVEPNPHTGRVYAAMTNNTSRTPSQIDAANPRANNKYGHIIEMTEDGGDAAARSFSWRIVLLAGPTDAADSWFYGYDKTQVSPISCPDNVCFDSDPTHLWIATDGAPGTIGTCDGMFLMPTDGPEKGHLQQFLSVPAGAECCGPVVSWDERSVLVCVQHPGEGLPSSYPYLGDSVPRPGVAHVFRSR